MTILRVKFTATHGLHLKGETYLIEDEDLLAALAANAIDRRSVELVKPGMLDEAALRALLFPPAPPEPPEEVPVIPAVEDPATGSDA